MLTKQLLVVIIEAIKTTRKEFLHEHFYPNPQARGGAAVSNLAVQDDFLRYLDRCKTEEQLFSPLTFALVRHPQDEQTQNDLLDDVRDAAFAMKLPSVDYKINQWILRNRDGYNADPDEFNRKALKNPPVKPGNTAPPAPACLEDVPIQSVKWLVDGLLPLGEVSLLGADGGTGKGIWQAQLIAAVTTGQASEFFPQPPETPGRVLIFSGEDDPSKVLKARLLAAGADMSRVMVLTSDSYYARTGQPLVLRDEAFAKQVAAAEPQLIIIDPLQSFLPADVEMASRNQMRSALLPLKTLCAQRGCAALISMHTNKKTNVSGRARLADSSDIWDIARSVLMMGRDKNSGQLYLSHEKSSYSRPALTTLLHIEDTTVDGVATARAVFDGRTTKKDADFVEERRFRVAQTKEDTAAAILNVLAESKLGSMPSSQLRAEVMKEVGCSDRTYTRAYGGLVKSGEVVKRQIVQRGGEHSWFSYLSHCGELSGKVAI